MSGTPTPPAPSCPTPCTTERTLFAGFTTVDDADTAQRIAAALVDDGLAACAQVSGAPVVSHYLWRGKRETASEFVVTVKFDGRRAAAVEKRLKELHPYDTPQWYAVRAEIVSAEYLAWAVGE